LLDQACPNDGFYIINGYEPNDMYTGGLLPNVASLAIAFAYWNWFLLQFFFGQWFLLQLASNKNNQINMVYDEKRIGQY